MEAEARGSRGGRWAYPAAWLAWFAIYLAGFIANGVPLRFALRNAFAGLLPDALLGLLVLRLPRLLPWPAGARARFYLQHLGLLIAFVVLSGAGWAMLIGLDSLAFEGTLRVRIEPRVVPWRVLIDVLIYGSLAGLAYAWRNAASSREQAARAARAEALRVRAELEAMRSQLNPHFILNTFHALLGLVRRDPAAAEEALERLGDLLRHSLRIQRNGVDEISLRDEWSLVRTYLDLERLRLGDRLRVSYEAEADTLDCLVPSFALQTLVENAVRHAIAPRAEGGSLAVRAHLDAGRLRIQVRDDGPGFPAPVEKGGLRLLRERLLALYGTEATLSFDGASAVLELPEKA